MTEEPEGKKKQKLQWIGEQMVGSLFTVALTTALAVFVGYPVLTQKVDGLKELVMSQMQELGRRVDGVVSSVDKTTGRIDVITEHQAATEADVRNLQREHRYISDSDGRKPPR